MYYPLSRIALKPEDKALALSSKTLDEIKFEKKSVITRNYRPSVQDFLLSNISLFPATYKGDLTPKALYGCQMVARKLHDTFDSNRRGFTHQKNIENDYLDIISKEDAKGYILVSFETDWSLAGISEYINKKAYYSINNSAIAREYTARFSSVESISVWNSNPELSGYPLKIQDLHIYSFHDSKFITNNGNISNLFMIFAPIDVDEATKINLYLHRDTLMYSNRSYLVIQDAYLPKVNDFEHYFPVKVDFLVNYVIFSADSKLFTHDMLEYMYTFGEVSFEFRRITELIGAYAMYLLAEATYYKYRMRWEDNTLYLKDCGYIQALDLREHFATIINEIAREGIFYELLPNFATASRLSYSTNTKCFYYQGRYYAALYNEVNIDDVDFVDIDFEKSQIEMFDPLNCIILDDFPNDRVLITRPQVLEYLSMLGYETLSDPDEYSNSIKLGYRTYLSNSEKFTVYYYKASDNTEVDVREISGAHNLEIKELLTKMVNKGLFFTQKVKNLTKSYFDYVPSDSPLMLGLSKDPTRLMSQLDNYLNWKEK